MAKGSDLIADALREIAVCNPVDPPSGEESAIALRQLNRILSNWQADGYATGAEPFDLNTELSLPDGYESALMLTLAEDLTSPFHVPLPPLTARNAQDARARIFHKPAPTIETQDDGIPGSDERSRYDYQTRTFL